MACYSLTTESTSNATAGTAIQFLMPASRGCRLLAVLIKPQQLSNTQQSGRWVVDRITAVATGSALTPFVLSNDGPASAITDTTITISTTLLCAPTVANSAICELADGWNLFAPRGRLPELRSGLNRGFAIRRATAPTGAQVVGITAIWEEDP